MVRYYNCTNIYDSQVNLEGKEVVIWGISLGGISELIHLQSIGAKVIAFTDSFAKPSEKDQINGIPIVEYQSLSGRDVYIYISTNDQSSLRHILSITDTLEVVKVLCKGTVLGAGLYDLEQTNRIMQENTDTIEEVSNRLMDEKSVETYKLLLQYRQTNDMDLLERAFEKNHKQYYPGAEIMPLGKDEVFVDAGAYNGETSLEFAKEVEKYEKIYAMEPDPCMFRIMRDYLKVKGLKDVEYVDKGAYSGQGEVSFDYDVTTGSSHISEDGKNVIKTISIDEMLGGRRASFIKMDIEGVEREAIEGCRRTIDKYKPKLAISIYHKEDDLWVIPKLIMDNWPFYKLYMRHYTPITTETVLYAVP